MTKKRSTKRALALSFISLLLCVSMFVGTTFAWFTDSVSSVNNKIVAGNLDVELEWSKDATVWNKVEGADNIFDKNALWEPGRVEVVYLKVSNLGTLALKYQLGVNVYDEIPGTNVEGKEFKLSEHLVFKAVEMPNALTTYTDREAAALAAGTALGLKDYNGKTTALEVDGEDYVALIVYMPETVGNEANYRGDKVPTITLGINLYATQVEAESDSFGKDYDADAWHPDMTVYNEADLKAALSTGGNIELGADVEVSSTVEVPAGVAVNLNLNGKTITGTKGRDADNNRIHVIVNNGTLTIKDGTVKSAGNDGGSAILNNAGATLTIEDVTVYGAPLSNPVYPVSAYPSYGINNYGMMTVNGATIKTYHGAIATGDNGVTVINDADIDVGQGTSTGITSYVIYSYGNAQVTVNGGKFAFTKQEVYVNGGNTFCELGTNPISINGGNYIGTSFSTGADREYVIKGGTFDKDPSAYVAAGFKAVATNGKYVVVADSVDAVVSTPDELKNALTGAAAAGAGDTTIYLAGEIDLGGAAWTPISVDGYHGAGVVTVEGNGATIKGLTAPLFAGGFAGKSGIVIKNLTIADSNIVSTSGLGGGAFIDTADSMHVITLENCHLVNSTVKGERTGGLIGWCSGYAQLNDGPVKAYVTISNCSVVDSTVHGAGSAGAIAGHPGASDYTYTTIEDCVVKNVKVISDEPVSSWRTGAIVGTANNGHVVINNVTVENVTLTQDGVTATETKLYGRFVPSGTGTLVIDGVEVLANATDAGLKNAIDAGNANVSLPAGNYKMPSSSTTGSVSITGTKDTVLDVTLGAYLDSANGVTIEGVTIKTGTGYANGNGSDYAALYAKNVTYINCTFVGPMRVGRDGAKFINCTFTELGNDYVWNYGNDVTFEGCTFNTDGKAILLYSDGGNEVANVTVKNCVFNSTKGAKAGAISNQNCAAIEIHNYGNGANLVTEGNTFDSNFSGEWRIKTYEAGRTKVFVNGTEYIKTALDGKLMTVTGTVAAFD